MSPSSPGRTPFKTGLKPPVASPNGRGRAVGAPRGAQAALAAAGDGVRMQGNFRSLPEAVRYFAEKANVPTRTWRDLWQGQHARAFSVAGAMKADLLADLRQAVDAAVRDGESRGAFRKRFDTIVAAHGWAHTGGRNWRSRVIYHTNIRTSFMAGKYAQLTDPDMLARHPYWEYRHNSILNPRLEHKAWNGLVLRHDHPWWKIHYPPNGWGCDCDVLPVSERRLREMGKVAPDTAPADGGEVPPEWQYNVGEAAWGQPAAQAALADDPQRWRAVEGAGPSTFGRPAALAPDALARPLWSSDADALLDAWKGRYGAQTILTDANGGRVILTDRVPLAWREAGLLDGREQFLPVLSDLAEDAAEIWTNWVTDTDGRYALRRYFLKAFALEGGASQTVALTSTAGGIALDVLVGEAAEALRQGQLVWSRP